MDEEDMNLLRAYNFKIEERLTEKAFNKLPYAFPSANVKSFKRTEHRVQRLSGFQPVLYDCCINSCVCFTGPYEKFTQCPVCSTGRLDDGGRPRAQFSYLPLIPRLRAMVSNSHCATRMRYRAEYQHKPSQFHDVFDGSHYHNLRKAYVEVGDEKLPYSFFSDPRDIALGLSTDGFGPFKRRKATCWPLVLWIYNFPPEERFLEAFEIGVIPGPKKPVEIDTFLFPLIQELLLLAIGVTAWDSTNKELFTLRAFLILVFGDIPAMTMIMRMKGHNGKLPCRLCNITAVRGNSSNTLYVPLNRARFNPPASQISYDPSKLPLRTHKEFMQQAEKVQMAKTASAANNLATACGIKGIPALSALSSLSFPSSFPYDFMHLIWTNLIPNLILLWTGDFKDLAHDDGYVLGVAAWEFIGKMTDEAGKTIPASFGARLPNIAQGRTYFTAEMYSIWTIYYAPILLKGRFKNPQIYKHFMDLVRLLKLCLEFALSGDQVDELEEGFKQWVLTYERSVSLLCSTPTSSLLTNVFYSLYYKHDPIRVAACPLTIHALLHIAPSIRIMGPVWAYWAFPMERICGDIGRNIRSWRFPYKSIDHYVASHAQLTQVRLLYNLHEELSLERPVLRERQLDFTSLDCALTRTLALAPNLPFSRLLCS